MNLKNISGTTHLCLLFVGCSIYFFKLYLENEKQKYIEEIKSLKKTILDINTKYTESNKKYDEMLFLFNQTKHDANILSTNIITCSIDNPSLEVITNKEDTEGLREFNENNLPIPINSNDIINNQVEKENGFENGFEILEQNYSIDEPISRIRTRTRGTSISEINWAKVTKKFIFG